MKNIRNTLLSMVVGFTAAFLANAAIVYGWNYFVHHQASFDWPLAFTFGIILGVLSPFITRLSARINRAAVIDK